MYNYKLIILNIILGLAERVRTIMEMSLCLMLMTHGRP